MDRFFLGFSDELEKLASRKELIERILKHRAASGAGIGGAAGAISDDESTIKGLLRGAAVGGALGGAPSLLKTKSGQALLEKAKEVAKKGKGVAEKASKGSRERQLTWVNPDAPKGTIQWIK